MSPLRCSVQIDKAGKEFISDSSISHKLYSYKDCIKIPPLSMIDDICTITNCGSDSIHINARIQSFISNKRLTLSTDKCKKMHLNSNLLLCPKLLVNDKEMGKSDSHKYLGTLLTANSKTDDHIKARCDKGYGIVNTIAILTKEISFGRFTFEVGLTLRNALLINGTMYSLEALISVKKKSHLIFNLVIGR